MLNERKEGDIDSECDEGENGRKERFKGTCNVGEEWEESNEWHSGS